MRYEVAKFNNKIIPILSENNKLTGVDWLQGFLKRYNNELSIWQPEGCSLPRASLFNQHNVKLFYENLIKAYDRSEIFCDVTRIYSLGETGHKKILSTKGKKQVSKCTSDEHGVLITTCCIIRASENTLPLVIAFPKV